MDRSYNTQYFVERSDWRNWLEKHFDSEEEVWLIYPKKSTGKPRIIYNDAVEEALCFGWIDTTVKTYDLDHSMQRFCPRRVKSSYSQPNIERLKWLDEESLLHPSIKEKVQDIIQQDFVFPQDILQLLKEDPITWNNYQNFSESYQRIRIAYIDAARKRPEEFEKRLNNFLAKTQQNKMIGGFGGIDKYY